MTGTRSRQRCQRPRIALMPRRVSSRVLVAGLPMALDRILAESERQLTARADATPMLLGSRGSALDLVMGAVYFEVKSLGLDPTNIDQLTVNQLARIKAITSSSNDDQGAKFQVKKILEEAGGS